MIKRIDIFMPPFSQYGVLGRMTHDLYESFSRTSIKCRLLTAEHDNPKPFLDALFNDPPNCTLSFNGLLPDSQGNFFCDMIKIPHVACLVDSPNQFTALTKSKRSIVTCPDLYSVHIFQALEFPNTLFFPHGVSRDLKPNEQVQKKYDVVFPGSCIDYLEIQKSWKDKYPEKLQEALELAAQIALSEQTTPYVEAFLQALNEKIPKSEPLDPEKFSLMDILQELEMFIRGKDRVELIKSIKDAKVHIFGNGQNGSGWEKYIGSENSNVTIHEAVPFEQTLEIMKQSKIVLNSCPWIKNGGHERIFSAMACGALVITSENDYMTKHFKKGEDIAFYNRLTEVNELVNHYLADEEARREVVGRGRKKIKEGHTWDHRLASLLQQLPNMLASIQN